MIVAVVNKQKS